MGRFEEMRYFSECDSCGDTYDLAADELPDGWEEVADGSGGVYVLCYACAQDELNAEEEEGLEE